MEIKIMIISHKHKFIFVRAAKVAGTSLTLALRKICDEKDVLTSMKGYDRRRDSTKYSVQLVTSKMHRHSKAFEIKERFPEEWDNYTKFSIVRDPWDVAASAFFYRKSKNDVRIAGMDFKTFIKKNLFPSNEPYYFINDDFALDFCLRFENLKSDINDLSKRLNLGSIELPKTKNKCRPSNLKSYRELFQSKKLIEIVANSNKHIISHFGYKF